MTSRADGSAARIRRYPVISATVLAVAALLAGCDPEAPTRPSAPEDVGVAGDGQLQTQLETIRRGYDLPAMTAVLVRGDAIVEMAATGFRAMGHDERVTSDDLWHLGSLTKAMTATLAAVLVERGLIDWESTVGDIFPELASDFHAAYGQVTLADLLAHTGGLQRDVWYLRGEPGSVQEQRRRVASDVLSRPPVAGYGTHSYSNAGYVVAGAMLERVAGEQWETLMRREVFTPLGMRSTGFGAPGSAGRRDQPWGHRREEGRWWAIDPGLDVADNPVAIGPAGTAHFDLHDAAAWLSEHLAGARGEDGLVGAGTFARMHEPAPGTDYALGWAVIEREWAGGRVLVHQGSNGLWTAFALVAPGIDLAMFTASNVIVPDSGLANDVVIEILIRRFLAAFGEA